LLQFSMNLPCRGSWPTTCQISYPFPVPSSCQRIRPFPRPLYKLRNKYNFFLRWGVVSHPPNPQAVGPPPVGSPRLLIQYIRSYPPYQEAVSSIHNVRTRHAVVTKDLLNMDGILGGQFKKDEMGGTYSLYGRGEKCVKNFCWRR
jgi:hypothetical protein